MIGIGTILGNRYEIVEEIGKGGMAIVYKAKCHILNRYVAVKVLRPEFREDTDFIKQFKVEAQSAGRLSHPNIVSIYDVGSEDDIDYIVMEYVEGVTLKQYIAAKGIIPWKEAVDYAAQICAGLEHAHKKGIVHKDIKPHNVIITREGILKITDFGIARVATSSTITAGGATMGSVHYFSPEQARGGYTDEKTDIYSLGVVTYEMVTGRLPFDGDTPISVAMQHIEKQPVPPSHVNPDIPRSLDAVIMKAMSKEQSRRYDSVTRMMIDLKKVYIGTPVSYDDSDNAFESGDTMYVPLVAHKDIPSEAADNRREERVRLDKKGKPKKKLSKKDKTGMIAGIATGVVLVAIFILVFYNLFGVNPGDDVELPSLVGYTVAEAEDMLKNTNLKIVVDKEENDDTVEAGKIISQSPTPNKKVKNNATIKVVVSLGAKEQTTPNLVNMKYDDAQKKLNNENLNFAIVGEASDTIPENYVIRQSPTYGTPIKKGETVTLYVSSGKEEKLTTVPNLIGLSESAAKNALLEKNLTWGDIRTENSSKPAGTVTKQSIRADIEVKQKTSVDFVVSSGAPATQPPTEPPTAPPRTPEPTREPTATPEPAASKTPIAPVAPAAD